MGTAKRRWILATHNAGKLEELAALLAAYRVELISAGSLKLPEPEETGDSFRENALIKARSACTEGRICALADDSGLEVEALAGAPGIYSARWAGPDKDFSKAMQILHQSLEKSAVPPPWNARFVCVLALVDPNGSELVFEGEVAGNIVWPPRGTNGFGYDPVFLPENHSQTFAEMINEQKHAISHRTNAFAKLVADLF